MTKSKDGRHSFVSLYLYYDKLHVTSYRFRINHPHSANMFTNVVKNINKTKIKPAAVLDFAMLLWKMYNKHVSNTSPFPVTTYLH